MSWAFSLGPKSRENTSSHPVPSSGAAGADTRSASGGPRLSLNTEPPRLAEPPRVSPLDVGGQGDLWPGGLSAPPTATTATTITNERKDTSNDPISLSQIDVAPAPAPGLRNPPHPNGNEHVVGGPGQGPDPDPERLPVPAGSAATEAGQMPLSEADWVLVPRQGQATAAQDIVAGSDARVAPCLSPKSVAGQAAAEGRRIGTGMASQPQSDARPDAQRHSSFKGLPPLRRNSSFGLAAFITADGQQQDESAAPGRDSPAQPHQAPAHQPQPHPHPQSQTQPYQSQDGTIAHQTPVSASTQPIEEATHRSVGVDSNATLVGQEGTNRTGRSSISISKEPMRFYQHPQGQQPLPADPNTGAPRQATSQPQQSPGQPDASPQPPSGWQLEESHLSEPLQVARRRAGTGSSQQQVTYGSLEKETGGTLPMSPSSPASGSQQQQQPQQQLPTPSPHPPRGRSSDVPPSSARRYPDLFRPTNQQQRDRADSGGQPTSPPMQGPYQTLNQVDPAQHCSRAGLEGSPAPSEGRRKSSNIFKGLGDRLSGAKSNERRSSLAEQSTPANGQQPVGSHASVQAQHPSEEPKKKRSSLLPSLKQRPSHDAVNEPRVGDHHRPATQETMQPPERAQTGTPQSEKKKSLLGSAAGRVSAAQQKYIPGGLPGINRASTSDVAVDSSSTTGNETSSIGPPKKRFSGFADKAAGLAGKLHRPSQEHAKPSTSHSSFSSMNQLPQPQAPGAMSHQSLQPPPSRTRDRSNTVDSTGSQTMVPPSGPDAEGDRQGRRGSFTGAMNYLWGSNRSSSKTGQPEQPGPYAGPPRSLHGDGQGLMGPPGSSQGPADRGNSMDAGSRASRQFITQTLPARPSPLAQQSAAHGPSSPIEYQPSHSLQDPAAYGNNGRAGSPVGAPSIGLMGHQNQQRNSVHSAGPSVTGYAGQDEVSRASMVSPVGSVTTEQGNRASVTEGSVKRSLSQRTVDDPQATPTSPVKRLPTPHASALLSSMAPPNGPGQSSATTLPAEGAAPNNTLIQDGRGSGYQEHTRPDSGQPPSLQFGRNVSLRKPVPQATSVPSRGSTPVHMEAVPPSAHNGSPARERVVSALVQQPGSQPQSPMGFRPPPPPAGHQTSPTPAQHATKLSPSPAGALPTNGPSDALRQPGSRQSLGQTLPQQPFQQPRQPQGPSQGPQQQYFQRGQQGAPQQPQFSNQAPYGQPGGPGPQQSGYPPQTQRMQAPNRQGKVPSQQQQGMPPQSLPFSGQQPVQPTAGSESKLKGWKNRVSSQMATITSQPSQQQLNTEAADQPKPEKQGWKARMSAMGQPAPQNGQPKPAQSQPGKPSTGGKLLGALKKVAKPSENPPPPPPKTGQPSQQPQWRPSPVQQAQGFPPSAQHPFAPHNAYGQYTQQGRGQPGPPPNAGPPQFYQQPQQYRQGGQYVQQQQHAPDPLPGQPGQTHYTAPQHRPPQPSHAPHHGSYGQQMAMHHTQQATHRPSEPQYDHVPIPQGYTAVHGEGMVAPTNYHVSRGPMQPQGHFSPQEQQYLQGHQPQLQHQQMLYQGQAPASASHAFNEPPAAPYGRQVPVQQIGQTQQSTIHNDTLVPQQVQSQDQRRHSAATGSPPDNGSFNLPIQGGITPSTSTPARTPDEVPIEAVQQRDSLQRPPALRHDTIMTDGGRSVESGVMGGSGQRLLPPGQPQFGHHLQPQSSNRSLNTQEPSREGSQISSTTPGNTSEITRPVSISPDADIVNQHERNTKDLNVDVAKSNKVDEENIYDATPRLDQNRTGASDNSMSGSAMSGHKVPVTSVKDAEQAKRDDPPMMELEDTADARMRTLRLNSQEEKIFYDPEGDVPKMSATSYPGQEWNPYGEPEFGDWKED
ncbi:uncharacterized protein F5Z01DRAFT_655644 [Emericellopsis atlantica]|uniref:Uncharacterized protein n=1 Tax=Emericellopsis atlantica TaxID=2614577 RepID=A0A9P8CQQ6_9HYPO|nr:uncharacterized protein F5Z01DRAFT_655644 [Emericellopsis atlantica]KAG9253981.1 hypothetical protein F5Z01DRAFT_655644 [Emericellopsis atlantica]